MRCNRCRSVPNNEVNICEGCGAEIQKELFVIADQSRKDILILVLYITWIFVTSILYNVTSKFVIPNMMKNSIGVNIELFMSKIDLIVSGIDFLLIIVVLSLLSNNLAKFFFIMFMLIRIALFIIGRIII
jgi:hypothetical protein